MALRILPDKWEQQFCEGEKATFQIMQNGIHVRVSKLVNGRWIQFRDMIASFTDVSSLACGQSTIFTPKQSKQPPKPR